MTFNTTISYIGYGGLAVSIWLVQVPPSMMDPPDLPETGKGLSIRLALWTFWMN